MEIGRRAPWILTGLLVAALAGETAYLFLTQYSARLIDTEFRAVLLDNGSAYFGKVDKETGDYLVLREVHYVQTATNAETKQVTNVLVKRGKEWHAPDRMVINKRHLVFCEPVARGSTVARLIDESRGQP